MLPLHRRVHTRYPVHEIVSYHYEDRSVFTLTPDLGLGGMKIKTPDPLPKDESLKVMLVLGPNSIWLEGSVVYSQLTPDLEVVSGIRFIKVSKPAVGPRGDSVKKRFSPPPGEIYWIPFVVHPSVSLSLMLLA